MTLLAFYFLLLGDIALAFWWPALGGLGAMALAAAFVFTMTRENKP